MQKRSGIYVSNLSGELSYKSFLPTPLPPNPPIEISRDIVSLLIRANKAVAFFNGVAENIPDINLFVTHYIRKEALMSSQIEGTQATLEDILDPMIEESANLDVGEVINYIKAVEFALSRLHELPLCNRLIREIHGVLMQGARGREKYPGDFRISQNWIGGENAPLKMARYIPPNVADMNEALGDFERYINETDDDLDFLIRVALIHYQFETIHPFLDGNGRVGRMLVVMYLLQNKVLDTPALYISYFLKKNQLEYYDRMMEVRNKGHYEQWVEFFLEAVAESTEDAVNKVRQLSALVKADRIKVAELKAGANISRVYESLLTSPIIEIQKTANALGVTFKTVSDNVKKLCICGILEQTGGKQRYRTFSYKAYLDILRDGTV